MLWCYKYCFRGLNMQLKHLKSILIVALTLVIGMCGLGVEEAFAAYDRPYYIEVDLTNQIVTIYNTKDNTIARQMLCSAGENDSTPEGTYYLPAKKYSDERTKWYFFNGFNVYAQYATRINGPYLFHSIPFNGKSDDRMSATSAAEFGHPASHGCIRLRVEDAKFIAKECLRGTRVKIFKSGKKDENLRQMLYISTYTQDEMTYPEFMGISDDSLGLGSTGSEVIDLQLRLKDLGYYDGGKDGKYDVELVTAVKNVQKDIGMVQNGIASRQFLDMIFTDAAPVSAGQITLKEGRSGPAVKKLQDALKQLGIYTGDLDSVYDVDVVNAVKVLQRLCGYGADGVATPEIQQLAYYEVERIAEELGTSDFQMEYVTEEINMARVIFEKAKIIVRAKMDTESQNLTRVGFGDSVVLLGHENGWANVVANGMTGYMYTKYLEPYTTENKILKYTAGDKSVVLGNSLEEYISGADTEKQAFRAYYTSAKYAEEQEELVDYVTVNTGSDNVLLNLREAPDGTSSIFAQIPNGTSMRVLSKQDGWTRVGYAEEIGYLMNDYLTFWQGSADEVEDVANTSDAMISSEQATQKITAIVVNNRKDSKVKIYAEPDTDSEVIKRVKYDTEVQVISVDEETGWVEIGYKDNRGYMRDTDLSFRLQA